MTGFGRGAAAKAGLFCASDEEGFVTATEKGGEVGAATMAGFEGGSRDLSGGVDGPGGCPGDGGLDGGCCSCDREPLMLGGGWGRTGDGFAGGHGGTVMRRTKLTTYIEEQ
jgi:hypothetical protein